ncbi:MAG: glycogen/starch/alpha-glucan phosphorylase, partial [Streptococcus sp.]
MESLQKYVIDHHQKTIAECSNEELYIALLNYTKQASAQKKLNTGKKKVYYISAEFLIGKLLSNNLINLGLYDDVKKELSDAGKDLIEVEEVELEPSLGNGGLGRLAACFIDSISSLGLTGDGVGLNYHFGLFQQVLKNNQQETIPNAWLTDQSWLVRSSRSYQVPFAHFTLTSTLYDIDVPGYKIDTKNRLRLFDLDSVDSSIIEDGINFDKTDIARNLTLFLYPDDSNRQGELLRIFQQYFMVSNGAQLIIDEAIEKGSNLHDLADYAVVQINDTHPSMVIPELIRLLTERGIGMDEAISIVRSMT